MKFINNGEDIVRRLGPSDNCRWIHVKTGSIVDLTEKEGEVLGLERAEDNVDALEGKIGDKIVETKVEEKSESTGPQNEPEGDYTPDDVFFKELVKIKGIGKKTAKDIVEWGTKEKLIERLENGDHLPFRDDVSIKLKGQFLKDKESL